LGPMAVSQMLVLGPTPQVFTGYYLIFFLNTPWNPDFGRSMPSFLAPQPEIEALYSGL
jgi:hypothetical protein